MAKYLLLLLSLIFMLAEFSFGQSGGNVRGVLRDSTAGQFLSGATVTLMQAKDSSLVSYTRTSVNGSFAIRNVSDGSYRLLITHVGYQPVTRNFIINQCLRAFYPEETPRITNRCDLLTLEIVSGLSESL